MNKNFSFNIDKHIMNIFTTDSKEAIKDKYHINTLYTLNQIHSNKVYILDDNYLIDSKGDALITNKKNTYLLIKTADCIPILIYDNVNNVIGISHVGWRGLIDGIVENTIQSIVSTYHSKVENLQVYLYPSIRLCHFEIKEDVYQIFKNKISNIDKYTIKKDNSYYIDMQTIIIDKLKELNIDKVFDSNICTYCNHDTYYSYRFNHTDKRNYLVVAIKE